MRFVLAVMVLLLSGCADSEPALQTDFVPLRVGSVLGETDVEGFSQAQEVRQFVFPADHGAHPDYRSEWWYLTLTLADAEGNDYGIQFTIFRQALSPDSETLLDTTSESTNAPVNPWRSQQVFLGHLAVTDVSGGRHYHFERFSRGHPALAGARAEPFAVWLDGWQLAERESGVWTLDAVADDVAIALVLSQPAPVLLQGDRGLSRKGPNQASYYFSIPGFVINGTLSVNGRAREVTGGGWYDREWSTSVLSAGQTGWDWFALRFTTGASLMAFQLRRDDGQLDPYNYAIEVPAEGQPRRHRADQFQLLPQRFWRDADGYRWPVEWSIRVGGQTLKVVAALDDQLMETSLTYWEGLVYVYDQQQQRIGQGYMELTGYSDE